jgi:hypothetical protein
MIKLQTNSMNSNRYLLIPKRICNLLDRADSSGVDQGTQDHPATLTDRQRDDHPQNR